MSTIQVGEINPSAEDFRAGLSPPIELPSDFDYTDLILCFLLGATILRCFYARICKGGGSNENEKQA